MNSLFLSLIIIIVNLYSSNASLSVQNKQLFYKNQRVFLSGTNIAWVYWAKDFGSGAYYKTFNNATIKSQYEENLDEISANGGNAIRVWLHVDGQWSPKFDKDGLATGEDTQSLIKELGEMLDYAAKNNIMVILCLWNLSNGIKTEQVYLDLYNDESKLNSYLNKVLKPLAEGLKDKPALVAYDIINEPEVSLIRYSDPEPCFDTTIFWKYTDSTKAHLHVKDVQRFVNHHADAIKSVAPNVLITVGVGNESTTFDGCQKCRNYYSDKCLTLAGGRPNGTLEFYQLHTYASSWNNNKYWNESPMKHNASYYNLDKPIVVGELSTHSSESKDPIKNYQYIYDNGYAGALNWQYNGGEGLKDKERSESNRGMSAIKNMTSNGIIKIKLQN